MFQQSMTILEPVMPLKHLGHTRVYRLLPCTVQTVCCI
jgi:hypothetical protein